MTFPVSAREALVVVMLLTSACAVDERPLAPEPHVATASQSSSPTLIDRGREIFRFDTFGDETYWTDTLRMQEPIAEVVSPNVALSVGLKVDVDALPPEVREAIANGDADLDDPATTVALLALGAVVGVKGEVNENNELTRVGITCALCHSTVNNSFATGIGRRLDGWPNRDLNVGAIVALSPAVTEGQRVILRSWGPGRYDPRINFDSINAPVVLPPAFGLRHVAAETYTGDGPVSYWNAYVAITQMHGHGTFSDPRIGVNVSNPPDLVSSRLDALRAYQLSLAAPRGAVNDRAAVRRGKDVFMGAADCARCHYGVAFTDINDGILHSAAEVGQDPTYALRSATKRYRTTPLRGLWNPPQLQGPYFHDGSAATLEDVVEHYVATFRLSLTAAQKADLVSYLKTL